LSTSLPSELAAVQPSPCFLKQCFLHSFAAVFIELTLSTTDATQYVSPAAIVVLTTAGPSVVLTTAGPSVVLTTAASVPFDSVMIGVSILPAARSAGSIDSCASCHMQRHDTFANESKHSGCGTR
jgi:hypothetical protein